ncbi:hypothetical protein Holit_01047 [Hollandina sp. SP2]
MIINKKLENECKKFRFKYSKKNKNVKKIAKKFDYYIFFYYFLTMCPILILNYVLHCWLMTEYYWKPINIQMTNYFIWIYGKQEIITI